MGGSAKRGRVYLSGAGPGDPGLITLAAVKALNAADVVLHDALSSPALLRHAPREALLVHVGKRSGHHAMSQSEINALLVKHGLAGKTVVRLKGGDPFVFGRGAEEALACRAAGVPFTVIPGVTSAIAAAAYAGIPLTHRGVAREFMVVTGQKASDGSSADWESAAHVDTLVILMGAASLRKNMEMLAGAGRAASTPVACVQWGTRQDQRIVSGTIADIADAAAEARLAAPMVTIVGEVAKLRPELSWFLPGPLAGKRIVVTRARAEASSLAAELSDLGARVVEMPSIRVTIPASNGELVDALRSAPEWLALTSANAADALFVALRAESLDARALAGVQIATIGKATAEALAAHGLTTDFTPSRATSEALAQEFPVTKGDRVVFPCSSLSDGRLRNALEARAVVVDQIMSYETSPEPPEPWQLAELSDVDAIVFASASSATNFNNATSGIEVNPTAKLISIGDQTSQATRRAFGRVDAEASEPSIPSLIETTLAALAATLTKAVHAE